MNTTYVCEPYTVTEPEVRPCHKCNAPIVWLRSFKTMKLYAVDVKPLGDKLQTARNWFHYCQKKAEPTVQLPLLPPQPPAQYVSPVKDTKVAKLEAMRTYVEQANSEQLSAALEVIFNRQTIAEQQSDVTTMDNNVGFSGVDAGILSDIHKKSKKYGGLRGGQIDLVRRKLKRYARQLADAFDKGEWKP